MVHQHSPRNDSVLSQCLLCFLVMMSYSSLRFNQLHHRYCQHVVLMCQLWRLVTNFLYFGPVGFNFLFNMIFAYRYCRMLEEGSFRGRSADFFFMFIFGGFLMIVSFHTVILTEIIVDYTNGQSVIQIEVIL
jgi:hypothetical protein